MIASVTFIAILMTILIQAPTTRWLAKALGLLRAADGEPFLISELVAHDR
jgi:cell volume regulation protein A